MVGDAGPARVHVGAAELLGGHVLAGRRLHERRAADEDRARPADDHRLVAHRRHVGAAGGARAHHDRDLRDPLRRHARLVEEDAPEVLAVGEHLGLERQERAAGVDEVDARQPVLLGDLLRAQVLLHREREVRAALHRRVVRDDHALAPLDDADPGDDAGARRLAVVEVPTRRARPARGRRCPGRRAGRSARARAASRARGGARRGALAAAGRDERGALAQLADELRHALLAAGEMLVARDPGLEVGHRRYSLFPLIAGRSRAHFRR